MKNTLLIGIAALALTACASHDQIEIIPTTVVPANVYSQSTSDDACSLVEKAFKEDAQLTFITLAQADEAWNSGACEKPSFDVSQWDLYESCRRFTRENTTGAWWLDGNLNEFPEPSAQVYVRDWVLFDHRRFNDIYCG